MATVNVQRGEMVEIYKGGRWIDYRVSRPVTVTGDVVRGLVSGVVDGWNVRVPVPVMGGQDGAAVLASILDGGAAKSGPVVLAEQHDTSAINWVGGVTDPGEMIACGAYQELRRLDGEADNVYQARLVVLLAALPPAHREKIETAMRTAALSRAGLDNSTGRVAVMVAGASVADWWHRLGVAVRDAVTGADALRLSSTDFDVQKLAATWTDRAGKVRESASTFVLVRSDTGDQIGSCGAKYRSISPRAGVAFLDDALRAYGARYETAGALGNGGRTWVQAILPQTVELPGGDVTNLLATVLLDHRGRDGGGCDLVMPTAKRVVCANTARQAVAADAEKGLKIRHTGDVGARLADAKRALGLAVESFNDYRELAGAAWRATGDVQQLGAVVLDSLVNLKTVDLGLSDEAMAAKRLEAIIDLQAPERAAEKAAKLEYETGVVRRERAKRAGILDDILERYESERCQPRGTVWSAMQAVTESANFAKWGKELTAGADSRRLESLLEGERDGVVQLAQSWARGVVGGSAV